MAVNENQETQAAEEVREETAAESVQETAPETAETVQDSALETLRGELDAAKAQAEEYLSLAQHVQADFDNFRKRNASVRAEAYADGQRNVAGAMLGVLDNLERALESAMEDSPLKSGVDLTLKQMRDAYTKLGVTEINRVGEKFDPNLENAVMQGTADEGAPGTVCQVLQKGYSMNGTVIRHAMVKVVADN